MADDAQVSMQVRGFAAMGALVAAAFAVQVAFADRYVVGPVMEVLGNVQARTPAAAQRSVRPHFEEEIIVVAPARGAGFHKVTGTGGHASRSREVAPLQAVDRERGGIGVAQAAF